MRKNVIEPKNLCVVVSSFWWVEIKSWNVCVCLFRDFMQEGLQRERDI